MEFKKYPEGREDAELEQHLPVQAPRENAGVRQNFFCWLLVPGREDAELE